MTNVSSIGDVCAGCDLCAAVCPRNAIVMRCGSEGFLFPSVNASKCILCGLCVKSCPALSEKENNECVAAYVARCKDSIKRSKSASGGLFGVMARYVVAQGGVVYGAAFVHDYEDVEHIRVSTEGEIVRLLGSKYAQSCVSREIYHAIREDLRSGLQVLFSGTPCQVSVIRSFLGNSYDNLYAVELICNSVASPLLWRRCAEYIRERFPIGGCRMRAVDGGKPFSISCLPEGASTWKRFDLLTRFYSVMWFGGYAMRRSCLSCKAKGHSGSDITIGDAWGLQARIPGGTDGTGVSVAMINTEKGRLLWQKVAPFLSMSTVSRAEVLAGNPYLAKSVDVVIDEGRRQMLMTRLRETRLRDSLGWFSKELELRFVDRALRKVKRLFRL